MKTAQSGTAIVVLHAIAHALHGLAHVKIPVPLSSLQSVFIVAVIFLAPVIAAILLWTTFDRLGNWLLLSSMAGAVLFGIYNHLIVMSPDHVSQVSFASWGLLFQITAVLTLVVDGFGFWIGIRGLKSTPKLKEVS
ncbi:MAG TPA: hypothetical protein V6C78_30090 [Crinalium sp.]|jgi:hypothetical protein